MWGTRLSLERRHRHRHRLAKTRGSHPGQQAWTALESAQACASRSSVALPHHRRSATSLRQSVAGLTVFFVLEVDNNQRSYSVFRRCFGWFSHTSPYPCSSFRRLLGTSARKQAISMALTWVSAACGLQQKHDYAALKSRWTRWQHGCLPLETTQPRQTLVGDWSGLIYRGVIAIVATATTSFAETGLVIINVQYSVMGTCLECSRGLMSGARFSLLIDVSQYACSERHHIHTYSMCIYMRTCGAHMHTHDCMRLYMRMH